MENGLIAVIVRFPTAGGGGGHLSVLLLPHHRHLRRPPQEAPPRSIGPYLKHLLTRNGTGGEGVGGSRIY